MIIMVIMYSYCKRTDGSFSSSLLDDDENDNDDDDDRSSGVSDSSKITYSPSH